MPYRKVYFGLMLAIALAGPCAQAQASAMSRLPLLGVGALGLATAEVATDMAAAIGIAVMVARSGNEACSRQDCAGALIALLHKHPFIGRPVAEYALRSYAAAHPGDEAALMVIASQAGLPPVVSQERDGDGRPIAQDIPPPPGDCSEDQQSSLQRDVDDKCKPGVRSTCLSSDGIEVLTAKAERRRLCFLARTKINETCFRGGDLGHRIAAISARNGLNRCESLLQKRGLP